MRDMYLFPDLY